MLRVAVIDFEGDVSASVALTLDALRVAERLAGRPIAQVAYVGAGSWHARGLRGSWSVLATDLDLVILPGLGLSCSDAPQQAFSMPLGKKLLEALRFQHARGAVLAASCTGTFALAEAGLLDGRTATTSWWLASEFRTRYPRVDLRDGDLTTEDGPVLCAAGSLAHTDLMLALISRFFGSALGTTLARYLVSGSRGPQSATADVAHTRVADPLVAKAIAFVSANLTRAIEVHEVADAARTSSRTLHRRVQTTLGLSIVGLMRRVRGEAALRMLRETDLSFEQIAERVGYRDATTLRKVITQLSGQSPSAFRRRNQPRGCEVQN